MCDLYTCSNPFVMPKLYQILQYKYLYTFYEKIFTPPHNYGIISFIISETYIIILTEGETSDFFEKWGRDPVAGG